MDEIKIAEDLKGYGQIPFFKNISPWLPTTVLIIFLLSFEVLLEKTFIEETILKVSYFKFLIV